MRGYSTRIPVCFWMGPLPAKDTTRGFSPKPRLSFGPALGLGVPSLGEIMDVDLEHVVPGVPSWDIPEDAVRTELSPEEVHERLAQVLPPGIEIASVKIVRLA